MKQRETKKDKDPFLIHFGFSHPHDTRDGKPELLAKYGAVNHTDRNTLPPVNPKAPALPIGYLPAHPFPHGHPKLRDEVQVSGVWEKRDERTIRNELGRELARSENIDTQVGRVLSRLKEIGELDNTYIVYTAVSGINLAHSLQFGHAIESRRTANASCSEGSIPQIMSGQTAQNALRHRQRICIETLTFLAYPTLPVSRSQHAPL